MAAERQKPARLDWRKPGAGWGAAAFALGGPLNPFALGVIVLALLGRASFPSAASVYVLAATPASVAMLVAIVSWLAPSPSMARTAQALGLCVVAVSAGLAISAGLTLGSGSGSIAAASTDDRINLGLAVLMLSLLAGAAIALSAGLIFRRIALRHRRTRKTSHSQAIQPREVGSA